MLDKAIERSGIKLIEAAPVPAPPAPPAPAALTNSSFHAGSRSAVQAIIVSIDNDFTVAADIVT
jgi:hypothetical protein